MIKAAILALVFCAPAFGQYSAYSRSGPAATQYVTFTPQADHYTSTKLVTITAHPAAGASLFYTTDGSPASAASLLYSAPLSVSANTNISVQAELMGVTNQGVQNSATNWTCATKNGGSSGGWNCPTSGGIGTVQPDSWVISFPGGGAPNTYTQTCSNATGECQTLLMYEPHDGDNSADTITQHRVFTAIGDHTKLANMELDAFAHISTSHKWIMCGFQCNQQLGDHVNGGHWQVDANDGWHTTAITDHCPVPTSGDTDVTVKCHWDPADTGCSAGLGCVHWDYAIINGTTYDLSGVPPQAIRNPGYTNPICGDQSQNDCTNLGLAGGTSFTCGRTEKLNTVSCTRGTVAKGYGPYTIP